jgi:prepilin-type N-terminal cleavage/methylation domain-containing protein
VSNKRQGFSLLEILVILAVLGILLGISGFMLSGYLRQQHLNEATRMFGETLRRIAETATSESQGYTVTLTGNSLSWRATVDPGTPQLLTLSNDTALSSPVSSFAFTGRGILDTTGHKFTLSLAGQTRTVYLAPTGAVMYP